MPTAKVPQPHADRIARVRAAMTEKKLDAYLIQSRVDQYWLTGFTGEDGLVLLTANHVDLLTDGRFDQTADLEAPWATKIVRKKRSPEFTVRQFKRRRARRIGFDPARMTVGEFGALAKLAKPAKLVAAAGVISEMRQIKDAGEIAAIRNSIQIAERAFAKLRSWVRPGLTEREVAAQLNFEMQRLGADEPAFGPIVATGASASLPHYEPGDVKLDDKSLILIDWGARSRWYVSDLTRVFSLGSIARELEKAVEIVREAHRRAIAVIRPGVKAAAVDRAARQFITQSGFGPQFNHSVGHAIGLEVHEAPGLRKSSKDVLKAGMVVTIEPGIYLPGVGGVRIEDDVLVTDGGCEVLSSLPQETP